MADARWDFTAAGYTDVVGAYQSIAEAAKIAGDAGKKGISQSASAAKKLVKALDEVQKAAQRAGVQVASLQAHAGGAAERSADLVIAASRRSARERIAHHRQVESAASQVAGRITQLAATSAMALTGLVTGLVGSAVRESFKLDDIARRVAINARAAGAEGANHTGLRASFEKTAINTAGIKSEDIGEATSKFVDLTGDLDAATKNMQTFATVASATGASVQDVAVAAASLGQKFNVKGVADMQKVMAILTFQGKGNALMMKDLAGQFQKLAAAGAAFGLGQGPEAVAKLGGLMQVARGGTRSAQSAGTAVENIFKQLVAKAPKLAAIGVKTTDKTGAKRDIDTILAETVTKMGGTNMAAKEQGLSKFFGAQGYRGITPLLAVFREAFDKSKAGGGSTKDAQQAGQDAVTEKLRLATEATSDFSEVEKDAANAQQSVGAQLTSAWESVKASVASDLMPAVASAATAFAKMAPTLIDTVLPVFIGFAQGVSGIFNELVAFGIVKPKKESSIDKYNRTKEARDTFEESIEDKTWLTDKDRTKREKLESEFQAADKEAFKTSKELGYSGGGKKGAEDWATRFADASGFAPGTTEYKQQLASATDLSKSSMATINGGQAPVIGRTDEQRALVKGRQEEDTLKMKKAQASVDGLASTFAAFTVNAAAASMALGLLGGKVGTIAPGTHK